MLRDSSTLEKISLLYPQIERWKKNPSSYPFTTYCNNLVRALVIKSLYSETHYTFLHAQQLALFVITQLTKELKKLEVTQDLSLFQTLRIPDQKERVNVSNLNPELINDHNDYYRNKLLSADGYFFNKAGGESAFYYGILNKNVGNSGQEHQRESLERELINRLLMHYLGKGNDGLSDRLFNLSMKYHQEAETGNLYTICIPKENLDKTAYISLPVGIPIQPGEENEEKLKLLERLQNDDGEDLAKKHPSLGLDKFPQYRIVMDQIEPGTKARVFRHSPVPKAIENEYKAEIKAIAQEIFSQRQVP